MADENIRKVRLYVGDDGGGDGNLPVEVGNGIPIAGKDENGDKKDIGMTGDAAHTEAQAGSLSAYGPQPENRYLEATVTNASAVDNVAFNTQTSVEMYEGVIFDTTAGEVTAQISIDGTTFKATTVDNMFVDLGAPATAASDSYKGFKLVSTTTGGVGPFFLPLPCKGVRFVNDGAVAAALSFALVGKNPL